MPPAKRDDPSLPTTARPGSEEKIMILAARHNAKLPLWVDGDCVNPKYKVKILFDNKKRRIFRSPSRRHFMSLKRKMLNSTVDYSKIAYIGDDLFFEDIVRAYEEI